MQHIFDIRVSIVYLTKMASKIISFHSGKKQLPLTSLMTKTLLAACAKQTRGIPFGPGDTKGSFTALITRGLIVTRQQNVQGHIESLWQVTEEAMSMLRSKGIEVTC